ncbi:hypothetical protein [Pontivivens nitratireducens]|uniref:hypothetical protein n=1 Tax=Pontivivens nitratireducens TaxID=2758038 RepID=UPI00163A7606|nr:hypothetical protein [Pontibrevibacter nitratireducens]
MAKCIYCKKGGWFQQVSSIGFCDACEYEHKPRLADSIRILLSSQEIIDRSKKADTKLSRISDARRHCLILKDFETKGISTITPAPSETLKQIDRVEREVIQSEISDAIFVANQKAEDGNTDAAKLGGFNKGIDRLTKLMDYGEDVSETERAISRLRSGRDSLRAELLRRKAETWVAKGKHAKAVDVLIEAIMALRHDSTPDREQASILNALQDRIVELGGAPPK